MSEQKKDIGALWSRTASSGAEYMTGFIELNGAKVEVVAFRNKKDGNEKRPDWRIYPSEPRQSKGESIPF